MTFARRLQRGTDAPELAFSVRETFDGTVGADYSGVFTKSGVGGSVKYAAQDISVDLSGTPSDTQSASWTNATNIDTMRFGMSGSSSQTVYVDQLSIGVDWQEYLEPDATGNTVGVLTTAANTATLDYAVQNKPVLVVDALIMLPALPTATLRILTLRAAGVTVGGVNILTNGTLQLMDGGAPLVSTSTAIEPTKWGRVQVRYNTVSATAEIRWTPSPADDPPQTGAAFAGDPGQNKIYIGSSSQDGRTGIDTIETRVGRQLGIVRCYDGGSGNVPWTDVDYHHTRHRLPWVSVKLNGGGSPSTSDIVAGNEDAWINNMITNWKARAPKPIWITFAPEPEDEHTTLAAAATLRAAVRYIVAKFRAANVTNFANMDVCYQAKSTFATGGGRDWRWWCSDWRGTNYGSKDSPDIRDFYTGSDSVIDAIALDVYNWWGALPESRANSDWQEFDAITTQVWPRANILDKPYVLGEVGVNTWDRKNQVFGTTGDNKTKNWFLNAYTQWIGARNVRALCYWSSGGYALDPYVTDNDGNPLLSDPDGCRYAVFAQMIDKPQTVVRSADL